MPYDHTEVARQIAATRAQVVALHTARADAAQTALDIYQATQDDVWREAVESAQSKRFLALPRTPLHDCVAGQPAGADYTVVATDSSSVAPDKHRGSYCYMINVGRVMVQYGDEPYAELDSTPIHHIDPLEEGEDWTASGRALQAQCALAELDELYAWATRFGADLALFDGTLIQSGLALSPESPVQQFMRPYAQRLAEFERIGVPVVGYISKPASQVVMRAARLFGCRDAGESGLGPAVACNTRCRRPECADLWTLDDADLFGELLEPGWRSPVFRTHTAFGGSQQRAGFWEGLGFCYLRTDYEIARLEFPLWVLDAGLLDRVHAIVLSQCVLGEGYPRVLTLAHNFAVLRNEDRESYFYLLEREGLIQPPSEKAQGKRATGGRI